MVQPVVGDHLPGDIQDQPPEGVPLVGVGADPPVGLFQVFVHRRSHIDDRFAVLAELVVLLAIDDVRPGGPQVVRRDQDLLHHVLDVLDVRRPGAVFVPEHLQRLGGQQGGFRGVEIACGPPRAPDGGEDLFGVEGRRAAVAFHDLHWVGDADRGYVHPSSLSLRGERLHAVEGGGCGDTGAFRSEGTGGGKSRR
jgi:hypothetical protein